MTAATRRRGDALEAAIYTAVFDELASAGYRGLTMEGVAASARTGKAALYRRWDSVDALLADALRNVLPAPPTAPPANEEIRADLYELLERFRDTVVACKGAALKVLKEDGAGGRGLLQQVVREQVVGPVKELLYDALVRGAERGDVRPDAVTRRVADIGPAMIVYQNLTDGSPLSDSDLTAIVDDVLMPVVTPT